MFFICEATFQTLIVKNQKFQFQIDGYETIPVRMPNSRKIQHICIEELSEAMFRVLQTCVGTTREALCSETTRVYGFNRAGQNISSAMSNAVNALISTGRVEEIEGKLKIKGE